MTAAQATAPAVTGIIRIDNVRLAFPSLFEKSYGNQEQTGEQKYRGTFILPPNHKQRAALRKVIEAVAKEKWGAKAAAQLKALDAASKSLIQNGDAKANYEGFADMEFFTAASKARPTLLAANRDPLDDDDGTLYAGCYVNVSIEVWAQDNQHGKRINATLRGVQFLRQGDSFGAGAPPAESDEFEDVGDLSDTGDDLA